MTVKFADSENELTMKISFLSLALLFTTARCLAAVEAVSPVGGRTVALVPDEQKKVMSLPTLDERLKLFAGDESLRQSDTDPASPNSFFGLVHDNFAPKPALGAYMTFIDARPVGSVQMPGEWRTADGKTYYPQWTRPDGRLAGMIWTVGGAQDREVDFSTPDIEFLDVAGARVRPARNGCSYSLKITDSPLYFSGGELLWKER